MGVTDAPQWLLSAFVRSTRAAGATAPREELEDCARRLIGRWQEPERAFHNLRHVIDVLARVDELAEETHRPDVVRLAAWYHGAVFNCAAASAYARRGGEDEEASADLARTELAALGVPEKVTDRVATLVQNLKRHDADPADADCLALSDADLATLAVEPQRYAAYRAAVRAEYAHLPLRDYLEARVAIITKLLARRRLYNSPFGAMWEEPARENLSAELQRLQGELKRLRAADPGSETAADGAGGAGAAAGRAGPGTRGDEHDGADGAEGDADARATADDDDERATEDDAHDSTGEPASDSADGPTDGSGDGHPARPIHGIEREPEPLRPARRGSERRGWRGRRGDKSAASRTAVPDDIDSTGSLFRPPPTLPRF